MKPLHSHDPSALLSKIALATFPFTLSYLSLCLFFEKVGDNAPTICIGTKKKNYKETWITGATALCIYMYGYNSIYNLI